MALEIYEIPISNQDPCFSFSTNLNNNYSFRFHYNQRMAIWVFDVKNQNGDTLASGVPFYSNISLLQYISQQELPTGDLIAINSNPEANDADADRFTFSLDVKLYYFEDS